MPEAKIKPVREFIDQVLAVPLFGNGGAAIEDESVIQPKTWAAAGKFSERGLWDRLLTREMNFISSQIYAAKGQDWFDRYVDSDWNAVRKATERKLFPLVAKLRRKHKLPKQMQEHTEFCLLSVTHDIAYSHILKTSLARTMWEPWFLAGHLPCGWKGSLPPFPIKDDSWGLPFHRKVAKCSFKKMFGDGQQVVM